MNMNQFTQKSLEAIQAAQSLAVEYGNQQIEQPHLLCALIGQEVKLLLPTGVSEPLILKDVTDYDLVCSGRDMKEIVFERASVLNIAAGEEG